MALTASNTETLGKIINSLEFTPTVNIPLKITDLRLNYLRLLVKIDLSKTFRIYFTVTYRLKTMSNPYITRRNIEDNLSI